MIQELQTERLDINNRYDIDLTCKQLDNIILKIIVYDKSIPAELNNYNFRLKAFKSDQIPLIQNTNITIDSNIVTIKADKQLTTTAGIVKAELQFINKTTLEKKSTFFINIEVVPSVLDMDGTVSTPTCTILEEIDHKLDQIENIGQVLDEAKTVRDKLETDITTGNTLKNGLDNDINTGNTLKMNLETQNTSATNNISKLTYENTEAGINIPNLEIQNTSATNNINRLTSKNTEALDNKDNLDNSIAIAQDLKKELLDENSNINQHINNDEIHVTQQEKTTFNEMLHLIDVLATKENITTEIQENIITETEENWTM